MKKFAKIAAVLASCAMMTTGLAACGGGSGGTSTITLTVWEDGDNIDMLQEVADNFVADYLADYSAATRIEIKLEAQSEKSAVEQIGLHGPSGNGADIYAFVNDTLGTAVGNGLIAKNQYSVEYKTTMTEAAVAASTINNVMYGYPYTAESMTIMYDSTKITAEQVKTLAGIQQSGQKIAWQLSEDAYYGFGILTDINLYGGGTDPKKLTVGEQSITNFVNVMKYSDSIVATQKPENAVSLLETGEIAGIISSPFVASAVREQLGNNFAIAKLPSIDGVEQKPFSGYKMYGVSSYSKNPYLAHAFCKYLVSNEVQNMRFNVKELVPVDKAAYATAIEKIGKDETKYAAAKAFTDSLTNSVTMPSIMQMANYWAPMQDAYTAIWNKRATVTSEEVKQYLETNIAAVLAKN